jgi:transcriptional regulator with XRE-family HTH domain
MAKAWSVVGSRIKALRESLKLSQMELARRMSCSVQTVSNWESERREPDNKTLARLAEVLGTSFSYLYNLDSVPSDAPEWLAPWWHVLATLDSDEKDAMIALLRVLAKKQVASIVSARLVEPEPEDEDEPEDPHDD